MMMIVIDMVVVMMIVIDMVVVMMIVIDSCFKYIHINHCDNKNWPDSFSQVTEV